MMRSWVPSVDRLGLDLMREEDQYPGAGAPGKSAHSARSERCRRGVQASSAPATLLASGVMLSAKASNRTEPPAVQRRRSSAVALDVAPSVIRTARAAGGIRPPSGRSE